MTTAAGLPATAFSRMLIWPLMSDSDWAPSSGTLTPRSLPACAGAGQHDLPVERRRVLDDDRDGDVLRERRHRHHCCEDGGASKAGKGAARQDMLHKGHGVVLLQLRLVDFLRSSCRALAAWSLSIKNICNWHAISAISRMQAPETVLPQPSPMPKPRQYSGIHPLCARFAGRRSSAIVKLYQHPFGRKKKRYFRSVFSTNGIYRPFPPPSGNPAKPGRRPFPVRGPRGCGLHKP